MSDVKTAEIANSKNNASDSPLSSLKATDDNVIVEDDHEGNIPGKKRFDLVSFKNIKSDFNFKDIGLNAVLLKDYLEDIKSLTPEERDQIIDQALLVISEAYVHLPLKQSMHAVSPVQRLKLLKRRKEKLSDINFHREIMDIFTNLRDLHTRYVLPDPFQQMVVFLPFFIEMYYDGDKRKYVISKILDNTDIEEPSFHVGVQVTHWNGLPIDRAVELNGQRNAGSNEHARMARGIERLTIRPLLMTVMPDEDWVDITYIDEGKSHSLRFNWYVAPPATAEGSGTHSDNLKVNTAMGIDLETELARWFKKRLFSRQAYELEEKMKQYRRKIEEKNDDVPDSASHSVMPDNFAFRTVETSHGKFGYIRIFSFNTDNSDLFAWEFSRILGLLPQEGLVIDVRANGGGLIPAGEKILQFLTDKPIKPSRYHFINTPLMLDLCKQHEWLNQWVPSIESAVETGAVFSQGFPLVKDEKCNNMGQKYFGPVVLITDALAYSTTDIFAAGFRDHEIGKIIGIDGNTGAGGANAWSMETLNANLPEEKRGKPLPNNASFKVAIRRTTRVGKNDGIVLEDLGVEPDVLHKITQNDLMNNNIDLLEKATELLKAEKPAEPVKKETEPEVVEEEEKTKEVVAEEKAWEGMLDEKPAEPAKKDKEAEAGKK